MNPCLYFRIIIIALVLVTVRGQRHDVCKNYLSYAVRDFSKNCRYSPDMFKTVCEIVERHVGKCETYYVTTEDGYILPMFRIPKENPKGVVILQHPVFSDANTWTLQENQSTAFLFWRQGYDVWLGNSRGNRYTKQHVNLSTSDSKFWDFSFHELGVYDYKAMIEYINNQTKNQGVIFVSHSMSATSILVYASLLPKLSQESIKAIVLIAPVANVIHVKTKIKYLALIWKVVQVFNKATHSYRVADYDNLLIKILRSIAIIAPDQIFFPIVTSLMSGWTPREMDPELINLGFAIYPQALSWKTFYHYAQIKRAKRFQMYDYGTKQNLNKYGTEKPTLYPLENITTRTFVVHSTDDLFSVPEDVDELYNQLRPAARAGKVQISGINHVDCHYGKNRIEKCYVPVLKFLNDLQNNK